METGLLLLQNSMTAILVVWSRNSRVTSSLRHIHVLLVLFFFSILASSCKKKFCVLYVQPWSPWYNIVQYTVYSTTYGSLCTLYCTVLYVVLHILLFVIIRTVLSRITRKEKIFFLVVLDTDYWLYHGHLELLVKLLFDWLYGQYGMVSFVARRNCPRFCPRSIATLLEQPVNTVHIRYYSTVLYGTLTLSVQYSAVYTVWYSRYSSDVQTVKARTTTVPSVRHWTGIS